MAKHQMMTFRLHRTGVLYLAIGSIVLAILIFAAGYLAGMRHGARPPAQVPAHQTAVVEHEEPATQVSEKRGAPPAATTSASPATTSSAPASEPVTVRVGVFASEEEAKASVQQLTARGLAPTIVPVTTREQTVLYTVRVGKYATRAEASEAAAKLKREQGLDAVVVPAGELPPIIP